MHIGQTCLQLERAINKFDHRVYDTLRMNNHIYAFIGYIEEPVSLKHLQAFIHQGSRIYGDLWSHTPGGMSQGLFDSDCMQLFERSVAKGSTRGGQQQALHICSAFTAQALPDSTMLAIHGHDGHTSALRSAHYEMARHY